MASKPWREFEAHPSDGSTPSRLRWYDIWMPKKVQTIAFRVDAGDEIGIGHAMRCRNLAWALSRIGCRVVFVCREQPGSLLELLASEFAIERLPPIEKENTNGLSGRALYHYWLGVDQEVDAKQTLMALRKYDVDLLVVDHYGIDHKWEVIVEEEIGKLMVIDDLADRVHRCAFLLDQNWFADGQKERYQGLVPISGRQMLGPHYSLLSPTYSNLQPIVPSRDGTVRRLFVYLGGFDQNGETRKVLEAISGLTSQSLSVDVVLPNNWAGDDHWSGGSSQINLYRDVPSLSAHILRADVAICAGGSTIWELLCLGTPTMVFSKTENQGIVCDPLVRADMILSYHQIDSISVEQIRGIIAEAISDSARISRFSADSLYLNDGRGAQRVAEIISSAGSADALVSRKARLGDERLYYRWRNEAKTKKLSLSRKGVSDVEHRKWYAGVLASSNHLLLIFETPVGLPIGQIRFTAVDKRTSELDYSVDVDFRNRGYGKKILAAGLAVFERLWPEKTLVALIRKENEFSIRAVKAVGFKQSASNQSNCTLSFSFPYSTDPDAHAGLRIAILTDPDSWINPYVRDWLQLRKQVFKKSCVIHSPEHIPKGDVCIILSFSSVVSESILGRNETNLVVHESDLPDGRGMSPFSWQVLNGVTSVIVSLIEAAAEVDRGDVYLQRKIVLEGTELCEELREHQANATFELLDKWFDGFPVIKSAKKRQRDLKVEDRLFGRRTPMDSQLSLEKTLEEQFNLLRIVDNEKYPAFFYFRDKKYVLRIEQEN